MDNTLLDGNFKKRLNNKFKKIGFIVSQSMYNPITKKIQINFKLDNETADNNEDILILDINIYEWYTKYMRLGTVTHIIKCNNINYDIITKILKIIIEITSINKKSVQLIKNMDILNKIVTDINNNDKTIIKIKSDIKDKTNTLELESYVLYKDDVPYFKIKSDTTVLISCKELLNRYIKIV